MEHCLYFFSHPMTVLEWIRRPEVTSKIEANVEDLENISTLLPHTNIFESVSVGFPGVQCLHSHQTGACPRVRMDDLCALQLPSVPHWPTKAQFGLHAGRLHDGPHHHGQVGVQPGPGTDHVGCPPPSHPQLPQSHLH